MNLIQCRYASGQRVPLLVQDGQAAPLLKLVPFLYVQLKLRHRAYNTAAAHLRAIQAFYTYAKTRDLDIDEAILACHFEAILALLDGYAIWLQSGRQADNLVARIGTAATAPFPQIDPRTRDQYLRLLKQYLSWCVTRYIPRARQNSTTLANIEVAFADVADVIERRFESHIINARPNRTCYRSLTDTQLRIIRALIRPGATENPFPERLQLRNWLMIELLLEAGIRRGELLKLYTTDINQGSQHAYVSINDREHDPGDPRAEEPALKSKGYLRTKGRLACANIPTELKAESATMKQPIQSESILSEILEGKRKRRDALMLALGLASPSELEGSAQRLREVMRKPAESRRQRILPPKFSL